MEKPDGEMQRRSSKSLHTWRSSGQQQDRVSGFKGQRQGVAACVLLTGRASAWVGPALRMLCAVDLLLAVLLTPPLTPLQCGQEGAAAAALHRQHHYRACTEANRNHRTHKGHCSISAACRREWHSAQTRTLDSGSAATAPLTRLHERTLTHATVGSGSGSTSNSGSASYLAARPASSASKHRLWSSSEAICCSHLHRPLPAAYYYYFFIFLFYFFCGPTLLHV